MGLFEMIPKSIRKQMLRTKISTLQKEIGIAEAELANYRMHLDKAKSELAKLEREY